PSSAMAWASLENLCYLGVAYVACTLVYQVVHYHFFHPLAKFPGPFWGGVTRLWLAYHNLIGDELATFGRLHEEYGMSHSLFSPARYSDFGDEQARLTRKSSAPMCRPRYPHHANNALRPRCKAHPGHLQPPRQQVELLHHRQLGQGGVTLQHARGKRPRARPQDHRRAIQLVQRAAHGAARRRAGPELDRQDRRDLCCGAEGGQLCAFGLLLRVR